MINLSTRSGQAQIVMLPHYILGYSELRLESATHPNEYTVVYHPNPSYESGAATLDSPPDLTESQKKLIKDLRGEVIWLWHGADGQWLVDALQ